MGNVAEQWTGLMQAFGVVLGSIAVLLTAIVQAEKACPGLMRRLCEKAKAWRVKLGAALLRGKQRVVQPEVPKKGFDRFGFLLGAGINAFLGMVFALALAVKLFVGYCFFLFGYVVPGTLSLGNMLAVNCVYVVLFFAMSGFAMLSRWQFGILRQALTEGAPAS